MSMVPHPSEVSPPQESPHDAPRQKLAEYHGRYDPIVKSEIYSATRGVIIISTVLLGNCHSMRDGFFDVFETRVFGASGDLVRKISLNDSPRECVRKVMEQHLATVAEVSNFYLDHD
jgi:hypothetical protein